MSKTAEEKELWVRFAVAAIENYERPSDVDDLEEIVDDVADVAAKIADAMMDELDDRFAPKRDRAERRRSRGGHGGEEEEEPE